MNLTVTEPESPGWMRCTPAGQAAATTSNVNFGAWDTVPNLVICKLGDGGRITINGRGPGTHVIGDVFGYFGANGRRLRTLPPARLLDTGEGFGGGPPAGRRRRSARRRWPGAGAFRCERGRAERHRHERGRARRS